MSFKVKALYEYSSPHDDDLQFGVGQIITVTEEEEEDWYTGEYVDESGAKQEGIFPRNFVEKYEPVAPPRPSRTRPKKEAEPAPEEPAAVPEEPIPPPTPAIEAEEVRASSPPPPAAEPVAPTSPPAPKAPAEPGLPSSPQAPTAPVVQSPVQEAPAKREPPPVSEKPSSFKDRIAAFNKAAAPPITPFKPGGLGGAGGSSSFIKKPFVAPPPKGNTYVPTQRSAPVAPVYRREEDPEIKEREAENVESAQKAGLLPSESKEAEEDQPKPLSLKERMALLQKQQQDQALRHAEAAAKKEKPKRPAKPRMMSTEAAADGNEDEVSVSAPLERTDTGETGGRQSLEETHPPRVPAQPRRKPSRDPEPRDGNEADLSGAGETTEEPEELTEREDSDEKPRRPSRVSVPAQPAAAEKEAGDAEEDEEDEDEEDEETQELRRKEELRARMARLGGGMGMPGMFGMPMPGAAPSLPPKKKKGSSSEKRATEESQGPASPRAAPPIPMMMPLPGLGRPKKAEEEPPAAEDGAVEDEEPAQCSPPAGKIIGIIRF